MESLAVWFASPGKIKVDTHSVGLLNSDQVQVKSTISAISMGTERLILQGKVREEQPLDLTISQGLVTWPFLYGYQNVGVISKTGADVGDALLGKRVFALKPHTKFYNAEPKDLWFIPDDVSDAQAAFLANMETAVTLVLDAAPLIGEKIAIYGLGMIGLCVGLILQKGGHYHVSFFDPDPNRVELGKDLGFTMNPTTNDKFDLQFELSGKQVALGVAIEAARFSSRIVVGSWYKDEAEPLLLGTHFHRNRISLVSSQVSTMGAIYAQRFDTDRRRKIAMKYAKKIPIEKIPSQYFSLDCAEQAYHSLMNPEGSSQIFITYH